MNGRASQMQAVFEFIMYVCIGLFMMGWFNIFGPEYTFWHLIAKFGGAL